jgi:RNA polymerase sigma factor (sigma-70 family)
VPASFQALMARVYSGDEEAGRELFEDYGSLLLRVVRRHLSPALRKQVDSTDFIQETWLGFLRDLPKERNFESPAHLATFLATMARNKVVDAVRRGLILERNNVNREVPLQENSTLQDQRRANLSTPSQSCIRRELLEKALDGLLPAHRFIGRRILDGRTPRVIAEELGLSVRTVERVRDRILERLKQP